jgi:hypothetical protein
MKSQSIPLVHNSCLRVEDGCEIDEMFYMNVSENIFIDYSGEGDVEASSKEGILWLIMTTL